MEMNLIRKEQKFLKLSCLAKFSLTKAAVWDSPSGLVLKYSVVKKKRKKNNYLSSKLAMIVQIMQRLSTFATEVSDWR